MIDDGVFSMNAWHYTAIPAWRVLDWLIDVADDVSAMWVGLVHRQGGWE